MSNKIDLVPGNLYVFLKRHLYFDHGIYSSLDGDAKFINAKFIHNLISSEPFLVLDFKKTDSLKETTIDARIIQGTNLGWIRFYYDFFENPKDVFGIWKLE